MDINLQRAAHISTIIAALIASAALWFGYEQYKQTAEAQREAAAVALFIDYLELLRELETDPKLSPPVAEEARQPKSTSPAVLSAIATTAEAIFKLRQGDYGWERTVAKMIDDNSEALAATTWACDTLNDEFVDLLKKRVHNLICEEEKDQGR